MRRKSERNKAKGSPEKKVEKPTRKSTRRRAGRKSLSTSPEKELPSQKSDTIVNTEESIKIEETESQSCSQNIEKPEELAGKVVDEKVPPLEKEKHVRATEEEEEDSGSVWKVARADASPGEIQKLKLCRQRNTSETSSDSRKKDSNSKWQESGEGVAGEVDSADEQLVSCRRMPSDEEPNDPSSSSNPGQESKQEEVSDSKDLLPETTSANLLSDDKPNIDRQGDASQADDMYDSEHGKAANDALPLPTAGSSNGELERKDSCSQENAENLDKREELSEEPETTSVFRKESSAENETERPSASTDGDDNESKNKIRRKSDSSLEDECEKAKADANVKKPSRAGRRKPRNKYGDSSNSDTAESEEESPPAGRKVEESDSVQEETRSVEDRPDEAKERSSSPDTRTKFAEGNESENAGKLNKKSLDNVSNKLDDLLMNSASTQPTQKPVKVNLKRSFAARITTEKNDVKKEESVGTVDDETASQNKENHADSDQERCIPRKRRWGTSLSTDSAPAFSISTDSLKVLVPGAKPLSINEVRLSKDDDEEREEQRNQEKRRDSSDSAGEAKLKHEGNMQKNGTMKKDGKMDNHIVARRKVSIVKEMPHMKSPSPPASQPTNILLIKNLVRPFTLNQIKELLSRTGTIAENGFWMDRIKSKCFVEYANEDQAFETRQALHGISWPLSNPKRLHVEYATKEDMEQARESSKDQSVMRKPEAVTTNDPWQLEWGREEKTNVTKVTVVREWDLGKEDGQPLFKDKEREKKEHDKKKRQRSRSPGLEAHLPAPARKFKKKEDEPPPAKLLDDLFRKTKATPCIYWLPLTNEQIVVKEEMRRQHMAEHARRLEEMRRAERNRDGRRRRSPRK